MGTSAAMLVATGGLEKIKVNLVDHLFEPTVGTATRKAFGKGPLREIWLGECKR